MMKRLRTAGLPLTVFGWLATAMNVLGADGTVVVTTPAAPALAPAALGCAVPQESFFHSCWKKVVTPTIEMKQHDRVCYDCKEYDWARTRCVCTPILTDKCPCLDKYAGRLPKPLEPECVKCGKPHTRKVLIKHFVNEELPWPKCEVTRVPKGEASCPTGSVVETVIPADPATVVLPAATVPAAPASSKTK